MKEGRRCKVTYLVVRFDVEFDLLSSEGSYSNVVLASLPATFQAVIGCLVWTRT